MWLCVWAVICNRYGVVFVQTFRSRQDEFYLMNLDQCLFLSEEEQYPHSLCLLLNAAHSFHWHLSSSHPLHVQEAPGRPLASGFPLRSVMQSYQRYRQNQLRPHYLVEFGQFSCAPFRLPSAVKSDLLDWSALRIKDQFAIYFRLPPRHHLWMEV